MDPDVSSVNEAYARFGNIFGTRINSGVSELDIFLWGIELMTGSGSDMG